MTPFLHAVTECVPVGRLVNRLCSDSVPTLRLLLSEPKFYSPTFLPLSQRVKNTLYGNLEIISISFKIQKLEIFENL